MEKVQVFKCNPLKVFSGKDVLKTCGKFTGEHPCRKVISIKLQKNFLEIKLRHGCSPVNLLFSEHLFIRTPLENCFCGFKGKHCFAEASSRKSHPESFFKKGVLKDFTGKESTCVVVSSLLKLQASSLKPLAKFLRTPFL